MTFIRLFPFAVAVLDVGAAVVYYRYGEWRLGTVWFLYAGAAAMLGTVR